MPDGGFDEVVWDACGTSFKTLGEMIAHANSAHEVEVE